MLLLKRLGYKSVAVLIVNPFEYSNHVNHEKMSRAKPFDLTIFHMIHRTFSICCCYLINHFSLIAFLLMNIRNILNNARYHSLVHDWKMFFYGHHIN